MAGKKSLTTGLDILVQMQGIAGAIAQVAGLTEKTSSLHSDMLDFGNNSRISSDLVLGGYREQTALLSKMQVARALLNKEDAAEFKRLQERLALPGQLPEDEKEALKLLEDKIELEGQRVIEMRNLSEETKKGIKIIDNYKSAGVKAFSLIGDAMRGVDDVQSDVTEGWGIFQSVFENAMDGFKEIWKKGGGEGGEAEMQEALTSASQNLEIEEIRVKVLRFGEAVGPEAGSKVEGVKKELSKAGKDDAGGSKLDSLKDAAMDVGDELLKAEGKGAKAGKSIEKSMKGAKGGLTKAGGSATKAGKAVKGVGSASKAAGPAVGGFSKAVSRVAAGSGRAGPLVAKLGGAIAAGGPAAWLAAAAVLILAAGILSLAAAVKFMIAGFKIAVKDMETLRHTNYRALGSIHDLTEASYDIGMATGLSTKQTMEGIKAMSHAGITAAELTRRYGDSGKAMRSLVAMQGKFSRMTGASADSVMKLQKQLMVGNVEIEGMTRTFDRVSMSMRKFGITGKDADQLMGIMTKSLMNMSTIYKGKEIDQYVDTLTELAGAAKRAGASMQVVAKIDKDLRQLKGGAVTLMALGGSLDQLINKGAAAGSLTNLLEGYQKVKEIIEVMPKGIQDVALANMGVTDEMRVMLEKEREHRAEIKKTFRDQGMNFVQAHHAMEKQIKLETDAKKLREAEAEAYVKATSTLTQRMQDMFSPIQHKAAKAMMPLVEGLTSFVDRFGPIIVEVLGTAIDFIVDFGETLFFALGWAIPVLEVLGATVGYLLGLIFKFGSMVLKVFKILFIPLYALFKVLTWIAKPIIWVLGLIYTVVAAIFDAVNWVLDGIASLATALEFVTGLFAALGAVVLTVLAIIFLPVELGVALIVGAVAVVIAIIYALWDVFAFVFGGIWSVVSSVFGAIWDVVSSVFGAIGSVVSSVFGAIGSVVSSVFGVIYDVISYVFGTIYDYFASVFGFIGEVFGLIGAIAGAVFGTIWDVVSSVFGAIGSVISAIGSVISSVFGTIWDVVSAVFGGIMSVLETLWPVIKVVGIALLALFAPILIPIAMVIGALKLMTWVFGKLAAGVKWIKSLLFGSSFLHIAEGISVIMPFFDLLSGALSFILTPIKLIMSAFGALWDMGKAVFGGLVSIVSAPFKAVGALAKGVVSAVKAPFKAVGSAISGAWNWLTGGDEKEKKKATKNIDKMGSSTLEAYKKVMESFPGPLGTLGKKIGGAVSDAWNWLTGGGEEEKATESIQDMGISMEDAYKVMESPLSSAIEGIGSAVSAAWGWLTGGDEKKSGTADIKKQMAEASAAGVSKAASAPMYTSKFDDDTKKSKGERANERESELVKLQQETVALLAKILDKNDPENERSADALEQLANIAGSGNETKIFRSREGFGEHVVHWWNNK
jgi:phage-related protein